MELSNARKSKILIVERSDMLSPSDFPEIEYEDEIIRNYDWEDETEKIFEDWVDAEGEWLEDHEI